jgi:hypothetical protein
MHISLRIVTVLLVSTLLLGISSCGSSKHSRGPKEYIEKNGLHSSKKPHEIAKEFGDKGKREKRAYRKQLKRAAKDIKKRNRKKVKGEYFEKK